MRLNNVVFPAPFGPMRARRSPGRTSRATPSTARRPPKFLVTPSNLRASSLLTESPSPPKGERAGRGGVHSPRSWNLPSPRPSPQGGEGAGLAVLARGVIAWVERLLQELLGIV